MRCAHGLPSKKSFNLRRSTAGSLPKSRSWSISRRSWPGCSRVFNERPRRHQGPQVRNVERLQQTETKHFGRLTEGPVLGENFLQTRESATEVDPADGFFLEGSGGQGDQAGPGTSGA